MLEIDLVVAVGLAGLLVLVLTLMALGLLLSRRRATKQRTIDEDPDDPEISLGEGPGFPDTAFARFVLLDSSSVRCVKCDREYDPGDCIRYTGRREGLAVACPDCGTSFSFPVPMSPRHASRINLKQIQFLRTCVSKIEGEVPFTEAEARRLVEVARLLRVHRELPLAIGGSLLNLIADLTLADVLSQKREVGSNGGSDERDEQGR